MPDPRDDSVLVSQPRAGVTLITLNRPGRRNALDAPGVGALKMAIAHPGTHAAILASSDPAAFSSGAGLHLADRERAALSEALYQLYEAMLLAPFPVISVIEGPAVGGGAQLALASDLRVGGRGARFRFPGVAHGLAVGAWGLPGIVGRGRAFDLCLTMRWVEAGEAHAIGLLDRLVDRPLEAALELAEGLAELDSEGVASLKRVVTGPGLLEALRAERRANAGWTGAVAGAGGAFGGR
jgi:enoyl-CoA hydratase